MCVRACVHACVCPPADELDDLLVDNRRVMLQSIADDLRASLPLDAMLPSEATAHLKVQHCCKPGFWTKKGQ